MSYASNMHAVILAMALSDGDNPANAIGSAAWLVNIQPRISWLHVSKRKSGQSTRNIWADTRLSLWAEPLYGYAMTAGCL